MQPMHIAHWSLRVNSGMGRFANNLAAAEREMGLSSVVIDCQNASEHALGDAADLHVIHTHAPASVLHGTKPIIWIGHGTPEVMFHSGYEQGTVNGAYGHGDAWMLAQFWLQHCDVAVTFWPRHQKIWQSLSDKGRRVECVPLGVDRTFWCPQPSEGAFTGTPSLLTAENSYEMKWPLDLFIAWPWVTADPKLHAARLHAIYVPKDQHRWWFPLVNRNGASFHAYIGPQVFDNKTLRNAFASTDYYIGLVRYGDHNMIALEAASSGAQVISYTGNPYATFWIPEGDQRVIADHLTAILKSEATPREPAPVPTIQDTAAGFKSIYDSLL